MKGFLTRKIGPFPAWAWAAFVAGVAVILIVRRRRAAQTPAAEAESGAQPNTSNAPPGEFPQAMIPSDSPGAPASGSLPIELIVTFTDAAKKAAGIVVKKPARKPTVKGATVRPNLTAKKKATTVIRRTNEPSYQNPRDRLVQVQQARQHVAGYTR